MEAVKQGGGGFPASSTPQVAHFIDKINVIHWIEYAEYASFCFTALVVYYAGSGNTYCMST